MSVGRGHELERLLGCVGRRTTQNNVLFAVVGGRLDRDVVRIYARILNDYIEDDRVSCCATEVVIDCERCRHWIHRLSRANQVQVRLLEENVRLH